MSKDNIVDGVDYGPLAQLIGKWQGDKGLDIAPEPDDEERNAYFETITFEAIGTTTNAESQRLAGLYYHQLVTRSRDKKPLQSNGLLVMGCWKQCDYALIHYSSWSVCISRWRA